MSTKVTFFFVNVETCWDIGTSECYLLNALLFHMNRLKGRLYTATRSPLYVINICGGLDVCMCTKMTHLKGQKKAIRVQKCECAWITEIPLQASLFTL